MKFSERVKGEKMDFKKACQLALSVVIGGAFLTGCASSQIKARKEQRDKVSQSSRLYCDFVNGELFPDVDVQLNIEMSKRCDSEKSFSVTSYKTTNENMGVIYCCALSDEHKTTGSVKAEAVAAKPEATKVDVKKTEKTQDKAADKIDKLEDFK